MEAQNNNTDTNTVKDTNTQQNQVQTQPQPQAQPQAQVRNNSQRLLTQDQVNEIVADRVNETNNKYNVLKTQYETLSNNLTAAVNELQTYKNRELAEKAGVKSQFIDFALYEAQKLTTDKKGIDVAITEFVKANPYVTKDVTSTNNTNNVTNKGTNTTGFNGQNNVDTSVDAEVEAFLKARGFKK